MTSPPRPFEKVLIIGAGPAGLLLALLLSQHSIPSLVLESWPHLDTRLRATQYGVPATRVFARAGVLPDLRQAGMNNFPGICWRTAQKENRTGDKVVGKGEKLVSIDLNVVQGEEDRMVVMQLGQMLEILYRHCVERGRGLVEVRFGAKVVGVGDEGGKAWVDVESEEKSERLVADYVVGCDGASSTVRRSLFGREWPGETMPYRFVVQNVYYDGFEKHGWNGGNYIVDPDHWGLIAHRGSSGLWRVTYGDSRTDLNDEDILARRPWHMEAMLPGKPKPDQYRIEQTNIYNTHNRCVDKLKVGRIFLAGDAAHVCNPMGGYGCMSAILDVDGLATCFAGYYHGKASQDILETYADVRRDLFLKYVDARSMKNLNRVASSDPATVKDTDKFFQLLIELNEDQQKMKEFLLKVSSIEYDFTQHYFPGHGGSTRSEKPNPAGDEVAGNIEVVDV